jgi:intracellular septation protein
LKCITIPRESTPFILQPYPAAPRFHSMKQFIDYIPLLVFFSVWAMDERSINIAGIEHGIGGIFSAAEFLLAASILVYGSLFLTQRRLDKFQWITLVAVVFFCIPTIIFRNTDFLKWKAPIVNWIFAIVFIGSRFFSDKPAIEHMMGHAVNAPKEIWYKLNTIWIYYFIILGAINLAVAFTLSEALWIQFKVFGNLILTFLFVIGQMPLLAKYIDAEETETAAAKASNEESI